MKPMDISHTLLPEVAAALRPFFADRLQTVIAEHDPEQPPLYGVLAVSHDYKPDPVSVASFTYRNPYANPERTAHWFATLSERGLMQPTGADSYVLTERGDRMVHAVGQMLAEAVDSLEPLPVDEMRRATDRLRRVIDAALAADDPPRKEALAINRASDPGTDAPPAHLLLQYAADLNAFRDDCHLNAWQPHAVSGPAWEALTLIWRDEATSAAAIADKIGEQRSYDAARYEAALDELAAKGWIEAADAGFRLTEAGQTLRQDVEDRTDAWYNAPWAVLSDAERADLVDVLTRLRDALRAMQPAEPAN